MIIKMYALIFILLLSGCMGSSSYKVKHNTDDPFADKSGSQLVTLDENFIAQKDPLGLVPFSQLIPYVIRNNKGKNMEMGFHLKNVQNDFLVPTKWLNIRQGDEIVFLADGRRISARATNTRLDHTTDYNSLVKRAITTYFDFAWYPLTRDQMEVICNSNNEKIKVYGNDGTNEYGTGTNGYNELQHF